MNTEVVKELLEAFNTKLNTQFDDTKNKLHGHLMVIQDILTSTRESASSGDSSLVKKNLDALTLHFRGFEDYAMGEIRTLAYNHDVLEKRVEAILETLQTVHTTIGSLQKRMDDDRPVEAVEAEVEVEETQEAALNAEIDVIAAEAKAKESLSKAVQALKVEEEEEEEEEEQEEEEEEDLDLESFTYKKTSYARDQNNNVYNLDEEGNADISEVVGIWNPVTKKIDPVPQEEEAPELEAFEYQKKTYCRDAENNVYPVDEDGCADISEIVGTWNPKTKKIDRLSKA